MRTTILILLVMLAAAVLMAACGEPTPTPTPTPAPTPTRPYYKPTPTPGPAPARDVAKYGRPTPTATPLPPTPTATPTLTPTPTPVPQRYQVFFDDIELVRDTEAWEEALPPQPRTCPEGHVPDPSNPCRDDSLSREIYDYNNELRSTRFWNKVRFEADLFRRIKILAAAAVPESEIERVKPGICSDLRLLYVDRLEGLDYAVKYYFIDYRIPPDLQHQVYGVSEHNEWGGHLGHLRQFVISECGEYVPFRPYQPPPDGVFDCANYEYREDAEEARWTYWYAEDLEELSRTVTTNDSPFYVLEYLSEWGASIERICGYLPSRNP